MKLGSTHSRWHKQMLVVPYKGRVAEHGIQEAPQDQEAADGDVQESSIRQTRVFLTEDMGSYGGGNFPAAFNNRILTKSDHEQKYPLTNTKRESRQCLVLVRMRGSFCLNIFLLVVVGFSHNTTTTGFDWIRPR